MGARVDFLEPQTPTDRAAAQAATAPAPRIRLPTAAVRRHEGRTVVWLVREGRPEARAVDAGPVSGGYREIRSGLIGGELIVVDGVDDPEPGMRVRTPDS